MRFKRKKKDLIVAKLYEVMQWSNFENCCYCRSIIIDRNNNKKNMASFLLQDMNGKDIEDISMKLNMLHILNLYVYRDLIVFTR